MPSRRTNALRGQKTIRIKTTKAEKKGFTVALAATASGKKFPAFLIFKERNGKLCDRVRKSLRIPDNVRVHASKNGWMTSEMFHTWLRTTYGKKPECRLLILDQYRPLIEREPADYDQRMQFRCNLYSRRLYFNCPANGS